MQCVTKYGAFWGGVGGSGV